MSRCSGVPNKVDGVVEFVGYVRHETDPEYQAKTLNPDAVIHMSTAGSVNG